MLKKLDRLSGIVLRRVFDLITGNYFIHQERRLKAELKTISKQIRAAGMQVNIARDREELDKLSKYRELAK